MEMVIVIVIVEILSVRGEIQDDRFSRNKFDLAGEAAGGLLDKTRVQSELYI